MANETLLTYYGTDPWQYIDQNQRKWYDPTLQSMYRKRTVYADGIVPYATQPLLPMNAQTMIFTSVYDFEPNTTEQAPRQINVAPASLESRQVQVTSTRYAFATAYDKYDDYISYWRTSGQANSALQGLIQERVGRVLQESIDLLIRNAFLSTPYLSLANGKATAADIVQTDKFTLAMVDDAILRAQSQNVFTAPSGTNGASVMCIGTPGHQYDIMTESPTTSRWTELQKYTSQTVFNQYEIGSYHNSRHFSTPNNILWNCGAVQTQVKLRAAHSYQDGSPDPATSTVDGVYRVGQLTGAGSIRRNLAVADFTVGTGAGQLAVGDMITISKVLNQAAETALKPSLRVTGAPKYDDGETLLRRIIALDATPGACTITIEKPLMRDFAVEINNVGTGAATPGSTVWGFVTKGVNLHVNIMVSEPGGIVCGVFKPPRIYAPKPIDLYENVYMVGYDMYLKFQLIKPEAFEVFVTGGKARIGTKTV